MENNINEVYLQKNNYRNNVEKSLYVLKDMQQSLRPNSVGYISIENVFNYIEFLENKLKIKELKTNE